MPNRAAYFQKLHTAITQNHGIVDFDFLIHYGGKQLHYKGLDYNPDANILTMRLVEGTYDDIIASNEIETVQVPVYTKTTLDAKGHAHTRTFNEPQPTPYPETGPNAPMRLAFVKLSKKAGGRVRYKLLGVCERIGPPTIFRPNSEEEARQLYPYHSRKYGSDVIKTILVHDQQKSRYKFTPF